MRRLVATGIVGLVVLGVLKAGAVVLIGRAIGLPPLLVSIAAALWMTGPPTVAWVIADRRSRAKASPP